MVDEKSRSSYCKNQRRYYLWFGTLFSRAYFFKGIILDGHQELTSLQHLIPKEEKTRIDLVVQHLMMQLEDRSLYQSDFAQFLNYHLLQLLIFSLERHHKPLRVALALEY
ncbi:hypothetical protein ABG807_00285 [Streptococcus iniae]